MNAPVTPGHFFARPRSPDTHGVEPQRHLVVDGQFLAALYPAFGKHVDEQLVDMTHEDAIGRVGVAEQAGIAERDRRAAGVLVQILLDGVMLPHEHVSENDGGVDDRTLLGRDDEDRGPFDEAPRLDVLQGNNAPAAGAEILHRKGGATVRRWIGTVAQVACFKTGYWSAHVDLNFSSRALFHPWNCNRWAGLKARCSTYATSRPLPDSCR